MKDYPELIAKQLQKKLDKAQEDELDERYGGWVDTYVLPYVLMTRALLARHVPLYLEIDGRSYVVCKSCEGEYPCGTIGDIIGQLDLVKLIPMDLEG